ncbi:MAG: hypothetical protein ACRENM_02960 [Candidatus Dormibacteraceae bacterium]
MESDSDPPRADFDLVAASIRADARDLDTFMEVMATKLEQALPGGVVVEREGGLFKRVHPVRKLQIGFDDWIYELEREPAGLRSAVAHSVRGITVKSETIELDSWIEALSRHLAEYARESTKARLALERLLG